MKWSEEEALFLDQAARRLEQKLGRRVSRQDVIHALVVLAMEDARVTEPTDQSLDQSGEPSPSLPELVHTLQASLPRSPPSSRRE